MQNLIRNITMVVTLALPAGVALADTVASQATADAYMRWNDGKTFIGGNRLFVGKGNTSCFSFPGLSVLNQTVINDAQLEVHCKSCRARNVLVSVCGELSPVPAPFSEGVADLQRMLTSNCSTLDIGQGPRNDWLTPIHVEAALQEVVEQQDGSDPIVLCIAPAAGARGKHTLNSIETNAPSPGEYAANLTVDYTVPAPDGGGGGGEGGLGPCFSQDTNDDTFVDVEFDNNDGDIDVGDRELCELPAGSFDISGILTLDGAFEFIDGGQGGTTLRRGLIQVAEDARIMSDFMSPTVTIPPEVSLVTLEFLADASISIGPNALITNFGTIDGDNDGDLLFTTKFPNTDITIDSSSISARNIDMMSKKIDVNGASVLTALSDIDFTAEAGGNIAFSSETVVFVGINAKLNFTTDGGNVTLGDDIFIIGDVDACEVAGTFALAGGGAPEDVIFGNVTSQALNNCDPGP